MRQGHSSIASRVILAAAMLFGACQGTSAAPAAWFTSAEPKCDSISLDVTVPKLNIALFKNARVWASSSGTTGVFFIENRKTAKGSAQERKEIFVVKFEQKLEPGVTVSRRILEAQKIPHDRLLAEFTDETSIRSLFDGIADVGRAGRIDPDRLAGFNSRIAALELLFQSKATAPRKAIITQFLPAVAGASSLGDALSPDNDPKMRTPEGLQVARQRFVKALEALKMKHNLKLLGYLYMTDAFLGNGDRLLGPDKNLANIFLAEGEGGTPCLVAIDNEAHAPPADYLAIVGYADQLNTQPLPKNKPHKSSKLSMTAKVYLTALLGRYKDGVTYKNSVGPLWAFDGSYLGRVPAAEKVARAETCDPVDLLPSNASLPLWVRRLFRIEFIKIITDMKAVFPGMTIVHLDHTETKTVRDPAANGFQTVCFTYVVIDTIDTIDANGAASRFKVEFDWIEFDQFFAEGAALASRNLGEVDAMKTTIAAAMKGMPTKNTDVVASALEARSQFFARARTAMDPNTIIDDMLTLQAKQPYAKAVTVPATTFVYVGDHWEPK